MRSPLIAVTDNIVWPRHGSPWAVWRITPRPWLHTDEATQVETIDNMRSALGRLSASALLASLCEPLSGSELARRTAGYRTSIAPTPSERFNTAAVVNEEGGRAWERGYWFAAQVDERPTRMERMVQPFRTVSGEAGHVVAMPAQQVLRAFTAADELWTSAFSDPSVRPATAAEVMWYLDRTLTRGVVDKPIEWWQDSALSSERWHQTESWTEYGPGALNALFDRDIDPRPRVKAKGHRARVGRMIGVDDGYQTAIVMTGGPDIWKIEPGQHTGGEVFSNLERLVTFPVDWFCRVEPIDSDAVAGKLRGLRRNMVEQFEQYEGDGQGLNTPPSVTNALEAADAEEAELGPNGEPELPALIVFAVGSTSAEETEKRARQVESAMQRYSVGTIRPLNGQLAALRAQIPNGQLPRIFRDYRQHLTPLGVAGMAPYCGSQVGDHEGAPFATNLDTGLRSMTLLGLREQIRQADDDPDTTASASMAIIGGLGVGKSYTGKMIADIIVRSGDVFTTVDRTQRQEWVQFALGYGPDMAEIVTLDGGKSIDPFACLPPAEAQQGAIGVLGSFVDVGPTSPQGAMIASAVRAVGSKPDPRLIDVIALLYIWGDRDKDPMAADLARRLQVYSLEHYTQSLFDRKRPGVNLDKQVIIFSLPGLTLPTDDQSKSEYMAKTTSPEQVWGKAITYLLNFLSRWVTFKDEEQFALQLVDEAWSQFASPYGRQLLHEGVRDSRKHKNGMIIMTHDLKEIPDDILDLLGSIMVGRVEGTSAKRAAALFGNGTYAEPILSKLPKKKGIFLYRDAMKRVAQIQVLRNDEMHEAMDSRPIQSPTAEALG